MPSSGYAGRSVVVELLEESGKSLEQQKLKLELLTRRVLDSPIYQQFAIGAPGLKEVAILGHAEFTAFNAAARQRFALWRAATTPQLTAFAKDGHPKALIESIAESLLATFKAVPLLDAYDVYQHLMDYWAETMQDDCYLIAADGWLGFTLFQLGELDEAKGYLGAAHESLVSYGYAMEHIIAWYSGNEFESDAFVFNRLLPPFLVGADPDHPEAVEA